MVSNITNSLSKHDGTKLLEELQASLSWEWDSRFKTVLAQVSIKEKDAVEKTLINYLGTAWDSVTIKKAADPENPVLYTAARCPGSVALDPNGNRIIPEVLQNPGTYDLIPATNAVEFACILDNGQEYLGTPTVSSQREMQVCQTIVFWGDIRFSRR